MYQIAKYEISFKSEIKISCPTSLTECTINAPKSLPFGVPESVEQHKKHFFEYFLV
jgi:hypothetical protein